MRCDGAMLGPHLLHKLRPPTAPLPTTWCPSCWAAITKIGCFLNGCCHGHREGCHGHASSPCARETSTCPPPPGRSRLILNLVVAAVLLQAFLKHRRWNGQILLWWIL